MVVLALRIFRAGKFGLNLESMSAKVISLRLQKIRRQILGAIAVIEAEGGAESRRGDTPFGSACDDISPSILGFVNGLIEEVIEQKVFEVGVLAVGTGDVLEED